MPIKDIMADVEIEGAIPDQEETQDLIIEDDQNINEQETATSEASPAENKLTDEAPSQEGVQATETKVEEANTPDENNNLPFNKHPRFKEIVDEKNYFRERTEALEAKIQQLQDTVTPLTQASKPTETVKIPKFFADVYGEDPEAYAEFLSVQRQEAQRVVEEQRQAEAREREQAQTQRQREEQYISEQFKAIEDKYGDRLEQGTSERNEFVKFYTENPISKFDQNGRPVYDLVAGYDLFKRIKQAESNVPSPVVQKKKAIASQTIDRASTAPTQSGLTKEQMAGMSFSELARLALEEEGLLN